MIGSILKNLLICTLKEWTGWGWGNLNQKGQESKKRRAELIGEFYVELGYVFFCSRRVIHS